MLSVAVSSDASLPYPYCDNILLFARWREFWSDVDGAVQLLRCYQLPSQLPCLLRKKQSSTLVKNGGRQWRLPFVSRWCLIAIFLREVESFVSLLDYVQKGASRHAMFMYIYMLVFFSWRFIVCPQGITCIVCGLWKTLRFAPNYV